MRRRAVSVVRRGVTGSSVKRSVGIESSSGAKRRSRASTRIVDSRPSCTQSAVIIYDNIVNAIKSAQVSFYKDLGRLFQGATVVNLNRHDSDLDYIPNVSVRETGSTRRCGCYNRLRSDAF